MSTPRDSTPTPSDNDGLMDEASTKFDQPLADTIDGTVGEDSQGLDSRFTNKQLEVMNGRKDEYMESTKKQKGHITRSVADEFISEILSSGKDLSNVQRKRILQNVQYWFSQRCRVRGNVPRFFHPYNARQVFYKENSKLVARTQRKLYAQVTGAPINAEDSDGELEDIDEIADSANSTMTPVSVAKANGKPFKMFDFLQLAISQEYDKLSEDEKAEYSRKANEWRLHGPAEEVKQSRAEKDLGQYLYQFAEDMYKHMGVKLYFFVSFMNTKGQHVTLQQDFGKELYGAKRDFQEVGRPIINKSGVFGRWNEYSKENVDKDGLVQPTRAKEGELYPLPLNDYLEPIIPSPEKQDFPSDIPPAEYLKKVIRSVISHCHALAMGDPIKDYQPTDDNCFHWGAIGPELFKYANRQCFPDDVDRICDPSSMRKNLCLKIVRHWHQRQQVGLVPLEFHSYYKRDAEDPIPRVPRKPYEPEPVKRKGETDGSDDDGDRTPQPRKRQSKSKRASGKKGQPTKSAARKAAGAKAGKGRAATAKSRAKRKSHGTSDEESLSDEESSSDEELFQGDDESLDSPSDDDMFLDENIGAEAGSLPEASPPSGSPVAVGPSTPVMRPRRLTRSPALLSSVGSDDFNNLFLSPTEEHQDIPWLSPEGHLPRTPARSKPEASQHRSPAPFMSSNSPPQQSSSQNASSVVGLSQSASLPAGLPLDASALLHLTQLATALTENPQSLSQLTLALKQQTPSRGLAEILDKVHITSSPPKPATVGIANSAEGEDNDNGSSSLQVGKGKGRARTTSSVDAVSNRPKTGVEHTEAGRSHLEDNEIDSESGSKDLEMEKSKGPTRSDAVGKSKSRPAARQTRVTRSDAADKKTTRSDAADKRATRSNTVDKRVTQSGAVNKDNDNTNVKRRNGTREDDNTSPRKKAKSADDLAMEEAMRATCTTPRSRTRKPVNKELTWTTKNKQVR